MVGAELSCTICDGRAGVGVLDRPGAAAFAATDISTHFSIEQHQATAPALALAGAVLPTKCRA